METPDDAVHAWHRAVASGLLSKQEADELREQVGRLALNLTAADRAAGVPATTAAYCLFHLRYRKLALLPVASSAEVERARALWSHTEAAGVEQLVDGTVRFATTEWRVAWCVDTLRVRPLRPKLFHLLARPSFREVWQRWAQVQPAVLEELVARLCTATQHAVRFRAATILGWVASASTVAPLVSALDDASGGVRIAAAAALAAIGDPRAIAPITQLWRRSNSHGRVDVRDILVRFGEPAVLPLIALLDDERPRVRFWAAHTLGRLGDRRALDPLLSLARREDVEHLRHAALNALGSMGADAVPALIAALADPAMRFGAASALGHIGDSQAIGPLLAALTDHAPDAAYAPGAPDARRQASAKVLAHDAMCRSLFALATPDTLATFSRVLRRGAAEVRACAATALGKIGGERAIDLLVGALRDPLATVRGAASEALGILRASRAVPCLVRTLHDADASVRASAAQALGKIGGEDAVTALIESLKDTDRHVGNVAAWALEALGDMRAVEPMIHALSDPAAPREVITHALGKFGDTRATEPLIHLILSDEVRRNPRSPYMVRYAIQALGDFADSRAVEPLIALLGDGPPDPADRVRTGTYWSIRRTAIEALGKLGDARAVEPLIAALGRGESDPRSWWERWDAMHAAAALGQIGDPRALRALARAQRPGADNWGLNRVAAHSIRAIRDRMRQSRG